MALRYKYKKSYASGGITTEGNPPSVKELRKKYANNPYAKDRDFWGSYLNESTPWSNGKKVKDILYNVANQSKVNPALLYSSAMEEGMQLYKTHKNDASDAYVRWESGNKDTAKKFPVDGFYNYGLDTFGDQFDKLVKKGYLKPEFKDRFSTYQAENEKKQKVNTAAFMSDEDALMAKSAMIRDAGDELDKYTTNKKIKLSPKSRDFFALAAYNGGTGLAQKMLDSYNQKGYLKDDSYLNTDFKPASYAGVYSNVQKRLQNADILQNEGFFSDYKPTYAEGGETKSYDWSKATSLFESGTGIADSIMGLFENNPNAMSKQPLVNATTMRNMVSPYSQFAEGGESNMDNETLSQLQSMAEEYGITVEELIQNLQNADNSGDNQENSQGQEEETDQEDNQEGTEEEYASGGKYMKYASGGQINVEGNEVLETPNGMTFQMKGPKHEEGGIDVSVPDGTKIFSDRLTVGGKSMQERHLKRAKKMNRLEKMLGDNPYDSTLKNTYLRTKQISDTEEASDMKLQKTVRAMKMASNPQPQFDTGGETDDPTNPLIEYLQSLGQVSHVNGRVPYEIGQEPIQRTTNITNPNDSLSFGTQTPTGANAVNNKKFYTPQQNPDIYTNIKPDKDQIGSHLTAGDYIGLGGNLFNAIAPIINTNNARNATKPVINRFRGFGHEALDDNTAAQNLLASTKANKMTDVSTNANAAYARNRNSASSINTQRALDIATQMGVNKANANVEDSFSNQMVNLLDRRGNISMQKDLREMSGEHQADVEKQQNSDNYYSNMARNLTNFGTNVQGIGKSLNVHEGNKVDAELLSQLSKYGLTFDEDGKLITI